jgi:hypothetical protein
MKTKLFIKKKVTNPSKFIPQWDELHPERQHDLINKKCQLRHNFIENLSGATISFLIPRDFFPPPRRAILSPAFA